MNTQIPASVDEYIAQYSPEVQKRMNTIREIIRKAAPNAVEGIAYKMAAYKLHGKVLIYFAGFDSHIGLYPRTSSLEKHFGEKLAPLSSGKGTIKLDLAKEVPYDFIREIAEFRANEVNEKYGKR